MTLSARRAHCWLGSRGRDYRARLSYRQRGVDCVICFHGRQGARPNAVLGGRQETWSFCAGSKSFGAVA